MFPKGNINNIAGVDSAKENGLWTVVGVNGMPINTYGQLAFVGNANGNYRGIQIYFPATDGLIAQRRLLLDDSWGEWVYLPSFYMNYADLSSLASALGVRHYSVSKSASEASCSIQISTDTRSDYGGLIILRSLEYACIHICGYNKHVSGGFQIKDLFKSDLYEDLFLTMDTNGVLIITDNRSDYHANTYHVTVMS